MNEKEFILKQANKEMINIFVDKIYELENILGKGSYHPRCRNCQQWIEDKLKSLKFLDILKAEFKHYDVNSGEKK